MELMPSGDDIMISIEPDEDRIVIVLELSEKDKIKFPNVEKHLAVIPISLEPIMEGLAIAGKLGTEKMVRAKAKKRMEDEKKRQDDRHN